MSVSEHLKKANEEHEEVCRTLHAKSHECQTLRLENQKLQQKVRKLTHGNVVLVRRDGFVAYRYIEPVHSWGSELRLPYQYREYRHDIRADLTPFTAACLSRSVTEIRFENTGRHDEVGRAIFEEI